ncbi:DUF3283 family protein [Pseudaeromonas paramecii]|uniref:DUF3283 family protein n=1 Tax=Pseudaeromonas paramecii TaxID=2138166 RepID=A0ABP8PYR0_9GAMM
MNLCDLPEEEQALIETDKAAAYAVWKERKGDHAKAEEDLKTIPEPLHATFLDAVKKYRSK